MTTNLRQVLAKNYEVILKIQCIYFLGREEGREKERERIIHVREKHLLFASSMHPDQTEPASQACALTENQTSDFSLCRTLSEQLRHTNQVYEVILEINKMTVQEIKLTCLRMITDYRGQKSVQDNRNKEKGMITHKPASHHTSTDYGRRSLALKITMCSSRLRQSVLQTEFVYKYPHGPIATFLRSQLLLFFIFKTPSNMQLLYYRRMSFLECPSMGKYTDSFVNGFQNSRQCVASVLQKK